MKRIVMKKYWLAAAALAAFASAGAAPASAQSRDHTGSMMPFYYDGSGAQVTGSWSAQEAAPAARQNTSRLYLSTQVQPHRTSRDARRTAY